MTRDSSDAQAKREGGLTAARVVEFLSDHPDFLNQHPEVLTRMSAPARELGGEIVDLQQAMIDRDRREIRRLKEKQRDLVSTSRENLTAQSQIHECVLALLSANSFEQLIQIVTTDFAVLLDLDIVTLCIESEDSAGSPIKTHGLHTVPSGTVDALLGPNRTMLLRNDIEGDPEIFDGGAPLVRSDALVRLTVSSATPPALLAFGTRHAGRFHPGQATELLGFLSRVLEHVIRGWLNLPD